MAAVSTFAEQRKELEERIRSLEAEKTGLLADIPLLQEKLENLHLQRAAKALEAEVSSLRVEKNRLEEEVSSSTLQDQANPESQSSSAFQVAS